MPVFEANLLRADDSRTDEDGDNEENGNSKNFDPGPLLAC